MGYATQLLAEIFYALDDDDGIPSVKRAESLLGVEAGCGESAAQAAVNRRYRNLLNQLQHASPKHVTNAFRILAEYSDTVARSSTVWIPADRSVRFLHALGFRDMKTPRRLLGPMLSMETLQLEPG